METQFLHWIEVSAEALDFIRARVLRVTLQWNLTRRLFQNRALRLAMLFLFAMLTLLPLSLRYPLWVLLIGPLVYGVPHILSSIRYFNYALDERGSTPAARQAMGWIGFVLLVVFGYRILLNLSLASAQLSEWKGSNYLELAALALTFAGGIWIHRRGLPRSGIARGVAFLAPLFGAFVLSPNWTIGSLILIHNFVAFFYWIRAAGTREEKTVAWTALAATFFISMAIFFGVFDAVYLGFHPQLILNFANLSVADTGQLIAPWSLSETFWLHACVVYAFGQGLHYFVWLKAIPDQFHHNEVPTSFRQSLQLLKRDFGQSIALVVILISFGSFLLWSFISLEKARLIYFALAAYHGYLEIAGIALVIARRSRPPERPIRYSSIQSAIHSS